MQNMHRGDDLVELMKFYAEKSNNNIMLTSTGIITSIDPGNYLAKVMLQPLGVETGWLPVASAYAGPGYGIWAMVEEGMEVDVDFEMGNLNVGKIRLCHWNGTDKPPAGLSPGEIAIVHKSGMFLRFSNSGNIMIYGDINVQGNLNVDGSINATGTVIDAAGNTNHHTH